MLDYRVEVDTPHIGAAIGKAHKAFPAAFRQAAHQALAPASQVVDTRQLSTGRPARTATTRPRSAAVVGLSARRLAQSDGPASLDTPEQLNHHATSPLLKRAGRRAVSRALAIGLCSVATGPLMGRAYARTAHQCGELLDQSGGTIKQYWCGHRWCATCGAIRTARAWHAYGPTVKGWADAQLVTLTVPNCSAGALRQTVRDMHHTFATLTRAVKRKHGADAVRMIRTTEVTYNNAPTAKAYGTYHPHMHLLVDGLAVAQSVRSAWLQRHPAASSKGQDIKPADAGGIAEIFKYATKLLTSDRKVVPFASLDVIYTALRGLRLWQPVGVTALTDDTAGDDTAEMDQTEATPATSRPTENIVWQWHQAVTDWVDAATGECLTGYTPTANRRACLATLDAMAAPPRQQRESHHTHPVTEIRQ